MADFTADHKKEMSNDYFDEGEHTVKIMMVEGGQTDDEREFVDFTVTDTETETKEGSARFWFHTDGAINFSFNRIREIFVHNAPDDKKDDIKKKFDALPNTQKLVEACNKMLIGKEAFYQVSKSDRTYESNGKIKHSYDRNLTGYMPTAKTVTVGEGDSAVTGTPVSTDDGNLPMDF